MAVTKFRIIVLILLCVIMAPFLFYVWRKYSTVFVYRRPKPDAEQDRARGLKAEGKRYVTTQSIDCNPNVGLPSKSQAPIVTTIAVPGKAGDTKEQGFLLTMVISAFKNRDKRNVIRRTWVSSYTKKNKRFLVKFVVGTFNISDKEKESLFHENNEHKDMVLLTDHLDSYNNLTRKVLRMFVWADQNVDFSYVLKTDDDSFANLDALESELKARNTDKPLYWGYIAQGIWPQKKGKWKEDKWDISERYLPYAFGGGYVLSADLVHHLVVNADSLILYNNEDVAIGAWVSPFVLERKHDGRFGVTGAVSSQCKEYLVMHYQSIEKMEKVHNSMKSTGKPCKKS